MLRLVGIGALGNMLSPAANHLSKQDTQGTFVRIYDHNPTNVDKQDRRIAWLNHGASLVHTIADLIGNDIDGVVICAGKNGDDVKLLSTVINEIEKNFPPTDRPFILHLSTVSVEFVSQAQRACEPKQIDYVNYPLTGGAKGAREATMLILASGNKSLYLKLEPLLKQLGRPNYFDEDSTTAAKIKLMGHMMVFNNLLGMASAISLQQRTIQMSGGEQTEFFDFLNQGAGGSRQWEVTFKPALDKQQWHLGFLLPHAVIDAIYTADLMLQSKMPALTILPILNVAAVFSFLLQNEQANSLATQSILEPLANSSEIDQVIEKLAADNPAEYLNNIVASLPKNLQAKVKLDIKEEDFEL